MSTDREIMRVGHSTPADTLAGAISHRILNDIPVTLVAIGAGAVNQMVKAVTIARSMGAANGFTVYFTSGFLDELIDGRRVSALQIHVHWKVGI